MPKGMKRLLLLLMTSIIACCAFGQDADYLIRQYRKVKGAEYRNFTKSARNAKKEHELYINPQNYELLSKIKKIEVVMVSLNQEQKDALTKNIKNINGYKNLYEDHAIPSNRPNNSWSIFPLVQYYGKEKNGKLKDIIIRIDTTLKEYSTTIIHIAGELTTEDVMKSIHLNEGKNIIFFDCD
jgi:hypothetical protein